MILKIACIVEGHGEQAAVPGLLARICKHIAPEVTLVVPEPIRVMRDRFLQRDAEFHRMISLAVAKSSRSGCVLVLLDSEGECPKELAPVLLTKIRQSCPQNPCGLVLAHHEFEAWFLASAESIAGHQGLSPDFAGPEDAENIHGCKEWLRRYMPPARRYSETIDQPALARRMDLFAARRAPSFDKLWRELERLLENAVAASRTEPE